MKKSGCRPILAALLVFLVCSRVLGEKVTSMIGAWAFSHEPDEVVLKAMGDGLMTVGRPRPEFPAA